MATLDQPELIEPEVEQTGEEAGTGASDNGDGPASHEDDDSSDGSGGANSGFVPIAVGLAALLPLYTRRRG